MMGEPKSDMDIIVEARLDSDGDPISKNSEKDFFGTVAGKVLIGSQDLSITMSR